MQPEAKYMGEATHKLKRVENRIWKYRKILNLSQRQVSFLLAHHGTSQISKWEKGVKVPSLQNALRLSHILKISVEDLFAGLNCKLQKEISAKASLVKPSR
jgi:transcriptional regulator with XRE-family HTH domain